MGHKRDKEEQFYETMPGYMDRGMMSDNSDRSWMRNMMPWLLVPAVAILLKTIWTMTSDKPEARDMRNKMREMPDNIKDTAKKMTNRDDI